jgi:hypothetical protein
VRVVVRYRPPLDLVPLLGLIPAFLLATYSLTEPWARGRAMIFWGIRRSPGAAMLLAVTLAGMVAATIAVASRGRRRGLAAPVHLALALLMGAVAFTAYSMIKHAGVKLLGLVPLASVRPGRGLLLFLIASICVLLLGLLEVWLWRRSRSRERAGS